MMKRIYAILAAAAALAVLLPQKAGAQQKIDPTVEVKRNYDANMISISKPKSDFSVNDSLYRFNIDFNYTTTTRRYEDLYEFSPLPFIEIDNSRRDRIPVFFARLAFLYPVNPIGDLYIQPISKGRTRLLIYGNHDSRWMKVEGNSADAMDNRGGIRLTHAWKSGHLDFEAGYAGRYRSYYGFTGGNRGFLAWTLDTQSSKAIRENLSSDMHSGSVSLGVESSHADRSSFDYAVKADYTYSAFDPHIRLLGKNYAALDEHDVRFHGLIGPTFAKYHKIHIGYDAHAISYRDKGSFGLLRFNPEYRFEKGKWLFNLGAEISIPFGNRQHPDMVPEGKRQYVFPDVKVSFQALEKNLVIYAEATGGDRLNHLSSLQERYGWTVPEYTAPSISTENIGAKLGITGTAADMFTYNLYGDYSMVSNGTYVVGDPDATSLLHVFRQNYRRAGAGLEILFKIHHVDLGADVRYSRYFTDDGEMPYLLTPVKATVFGRYTWKDRITARMHLDYYHGTDALFYSSPLELERTRTAGFINLGVYLSYMVNRNLSVFLTGENLINSKQEYIYGYTLPGINFGAGLYVKF